MRCIYPFNMQSVFGQFPVVTGDQGVDPGVVTFKKDGVWRTPLVDFNGRWHTIEDAGLNPLPVQQPIPIWFGGNAEAVLKRIARSGDGWMPNYKAATDALPSLEAIHKYLEEAGRSREEIGIEFRLPYGDGDPNTWTRTIQEWQTIGATHMSFNTMGSGFFTPAEHLAAVRKFASVIGIN